MPCGSGSQTRFWQRNLLNNELLQHGDSISNRKSVADQLSAGESMVLRSLFAFVHAKWLKPSLPFLPFPFSLSTAITPLPLFLTPCPPSEPSPPPPPSARRHGAEQRLRRRRGAALRSQQRLLPGEGKQQDGGLLWLLAAVRCTVSTMARCTAPHCTALHCTR